MLPLGYRSREKHKPRRETEMFSLIQIDSLTTLMFAKTANGTDYYDILVDGGKFGSNQISVISGSDDAEVALQFALQTSIALV